MIREAYTSTVVGRAHLTVGVLLAGGLAVSIALAGAPDWLAVVAGLLLVATAGQLSTVHLSIGADGIRAGHGWRRGAGRRVPPSSVLEAACVELRWPQVFGLGVPLHRRVLRLTVRPGPTLVLRLAGHDHLRISTSDAATAVRLITHRPARGEELS